MRCMNCGCELPENAKFCMECGMSIEEKIKSEDNNLDKNVMKPLESNNELSVIFNSMDPVAIHLEYYGKYRPEKTVINGEWILYYDDVSEVFYLMDIHGNRKKELSLEKELHWCSFLGMNKAGIWFMDCSSERYTWDDMPWYNQIICVDASSGKRHKISFNQMEGNVRQLPYIWGNQIHYVSELSSGEKQVLWIDSNGIEHIVYNTNKEECICDISADSSRIAFYVSTNEEDCIDCYYIYNKFTGELVQLGITRDPKADWLPFVRINRMDLQKNIIWTNMTEGERERYSAEEDDWVARPLTEPKEYQVLSYKNAKKTAIYKGLGHGDIVYFDGKDAYSSDTYGLKRINRLGAQYEVRYGGHGMGDKIMVSQDYVFVNYDAFDTVRLPRDFSSAEVMGKDHAQAVLVFDRGYCL